MGNKDRMIAFKVPKEKMAELEKVSEDKGQTIAGMVRQFVYEKLNEIQAAN